MLSTKNLTKIYKTKGGAETYALKNVSITFPETGMVFLLGKSGSGKSTLLNVCGGLDDPTSGEVIVKGRSSKNFTRSDFDSYRNTFIGFIFQEYNILNEFTVEQNIALALELQGKKKDKAAINALLEQVDLKDFAKRKPNTLSGGQKQRIAIARALIKNPEIIMADEPTGALDSNTGKQVFDTLKKLSLEKLVIVVSHDREFAEQYGDRIIELKDGEILTDYHKVKEDGLDVSENVSVLGENTICVQDGTNLSKDDEKYIIEFLKNTQGNVTITNGVREQETFKASTRITDDNKIEVFKETDINEIIEKEYTKEDSKFIRSKLPAKHAFKIGASGLKTKPFRLVLTILLSVISFVMFGLVSTFMDYNGEEVFGNTLRNREEINNIILQKKYTSRVTYYENDKEQYHSDRDNEILMSEEDFNNFKQKLGNDVYPALKARYGGETFVVDDNSNAYYQTRIYYYAYLPDGNSLKDADLQGNYPVEKNEVAITKYIAKALLEGKNQSEGITAQTTEEQLIGKNINVNGNSYKIVGIVDTKMSNIPTEYNDLQDKTMGNADPKVINKFQTYLEDSIHATLFISDSLLRSKTKNSMGYNYWNDIQARYDVTYDLNYESSWTPTASLGLYPNKKVNGLAWSFFDTTKTTVEEGEILITTGLVRSTFSDFPNYDDVYQEEEELNRQEWALYDEEWNLDSDLNSQTCNMDYIMQLWAENKAIPNSDMWLYSIYNDYLQLDSESFNEQYGECSFNFSDLKDIYIYVEDDIPSTDPAYEYAIRYKDIVERKATIAEKRLEIEAKRQYAEQLNKLRDKVLDGYYWDSDLSETVYLTVEERQVAIGQLVNILFEDEKYYELEIQAYSWDFNGGVGAKKGMKVVGMIYSDSENSISDFILANEKDYNEISDIVASYQQGSSYKEVIETKYEDKGDGVYRYIVIPYDHSQKITDDIVVALRVDDNDVFYEPMLSIYQTYYTLNLLIESLSKIFLYVGLVLAVFSMLLLANFISISISAKKKEIGILRAVGARSLDIFKIFFSESGIISGICFVISLVATFIGCNYISATSARELNISLFTITPLTIGLLFAIALITAVIATFFPVYSAARKKPVESIRAL